MPRSAPESELGTAETMDHFHKIVLKVLLVDEVQGLGRTSRSSTSTLGSKASDQETWRKEVRFNGFQNQKFKQRHIHKTCKVPYTGTMASWSSQPYKRLSIVKMNYVHI